MHGVADRDQGGDRQRHAMGGGDHLLGDRARLADERDGGLAGVRAARHGAQEGRGEPVVGRQVDDAGAIGTRNGEAVLGGDRADLGVARAAGLTRLGEAARQDQEILVTGARGLAHDIGNRVGTNHHHREVGRRGQRAQGRRHRQIEQRAALRIDRQDRAGIAADPQVLQDGAARRGRAVAGADDGNAARREERTQVARHQISTVAVTGTWSVAGVQSRAARAM